MKAKYVWRLKLGVKENRNMDIQIVDIAELLLFVLLIAILV